MDTQINRAWKLRMALTQWTRSAPSSADPAQLSNKSIQTLILRAEHKTSVTLYQTLRNALVPAYQKVSKRLRRVRRLKRSNSASCALQPKSRVFSQRAKIIMKNIRVMKKSQSKSNLRLVLSMTKLRHNCKTKKTLLVLMKRMFQT